jgi:hypothetical protein
MEASMRKLFQKTSKFLLNFEICTNVDTTQSVLFLEIGCNLHGEKEIMGQVLQRLLEVFYTKKLDIVVIGLENR